jgi:integrase
MNAIKMVLTDRYLKSLTPAERGKRRVIWDAAHQSFGVRVTDRGHVSFFVLRRMPGKKQPIRVVLGSYPRTTLAQARAKATKGLEDLASGVHPRDRKRLEQLEKEKREASKFAALATEFISKHAARKRTAALIQRLIERELISRWGSRPVGDIGRADAIRMVEEIGERNGLYAAHQALAYARRIFNWALAREYRGLDRNPCERVNASELVGETTARQRVLTEHELRLIWQATEGTVLDAYPLAPFIRLLLLTGARRSEVAQMAWPELDLDQALWVIPRGRIKTDIAHAIPLSILAVDLLRTLPTFNWGKFVLSTTAGRRPISGFMKLKARLDRRIAALSPGGIADWRLHDLRRTVRTNLSSLGVSPFIAELVIGHRQGGVHAVYDLHRYEAEKRDALNQWAAKLRSIVEPPPANVVEFRVGR